MAQDKPEIIERTYQETQEWLHEIAGNLERPDDLHAAYHALRSVLHTLRDNLVPDEALDLSSQLPVLIRGIYFEGYRLSGRPVTHRTVDSFLDAVRTQLNTEAPEDLDPERCSRAVFGTLSGHLDAGQVRQARDMLHKDVQGLWSAG